MRARRDDGRGLVMTQRTQARTGNDEGMHHWGSPNTTAQLPNIVKAMVKIVGRYCDASRWAFPAEYIEVWNEPNQPGSWDPQGPG